MPRPIEHTATYDCTPAVLHAALTDRGYWQARLVAVGGGGATLDSFTATDGGARVALTQVIEAANLPSIVGRIKAGDLAITRTEAWGPLGAGTGAATASASAEVTAEVSGTPATVTGTTTLAGADTTTVRTHGHVRVPVPLVGGTIEQAVADNVVRLLQAEQHFTEQWLREH